MDLITAEKISANRIELYIKSKDAVAAELYLRLAADGDIDPSLCFLAVSEGREKGCIVIKETFAGDVKVAAVLIAVGDDTDRKMMFDNVYELLRGRGDQYITVFGERDFYVGIGWLWAPEFGIMHPRLDEAYTYWAKKLDPDAKPPLTVVSFPKAAGIKNPEFRLTVDSVMPEERVEKTMYEVRSRRRYAERAALIVFIITCTVFGLLAKNFSAVPAVGIGLVLLYRNIFVPIKLVNGVIETRREHNCNGWHEWYGFTDSEIFKYDLGHQRHAQFWPYSSIRIVYVKKDYLFLCTGWDNKSADGMYVMLGDDEAKQALVGLLREKSPNAVFKK